MGVGWAQVTEEARMEMVVDVLAAVAGEATGWNWAQAGEVVTAPADRVMVVAAGWAQELGEVSSGMEMTAAL